MEVVAIFVDVRQTQPLNQTICLSIPILGIVEWPPIQRSISVINVQPIVIITLTCAY